MARLKYKDDQGAYQAIGPDFHVTVNQMPTVSSADNGRFARVVNGEWAAAAISQAESVAIKAQPDAEYLMAGSSYLALNNAVNNVVPGASGYHTLSQLITLLEGL